MEHDRTYIQIFKYFSANDETASNKIVYMLRIKSLSISLK